MTKMGSPSVSPLESPATSSRPHLQSWENILWELSLATSFACMGLFEA